MKTEHVTIIKMAVAVAMLPFSSTFSALGAESTNRTAPPPANSLIIRGSNHSRSNAPGVVAASEVTPEYLFGLQLEQALRTNGLQFIINAFDPDAFYHRFVPSLPVSDETKQQLLATARNESMTQTAVKEMISDLGGAPRIRFLGTRQLGEDRVLLFRGLDANDAPFQTGHPGYIAYVVGVRPDGSVRLVDAHRFSRGEMMSHTVRRRSFLDLADKNLVIPEIMNAEDRQMLTGHQELSTFEQQCAYGNFASVKAAYDLMPPEVQNDRLMLFHYATVGNRTSEQFLIPIERWRRVYPSDPTPDLVLVDLYWRLHDRPHFVEKTEKQQNGHTEPPGWSQKEAEAQDAAIERANTWFADPAMELTLAAHYGTKQPEKTRALLVKAMNRKPLEEVVFTDLLKLDLAKGNFNGIADTLHRAETALHTNLTQMVNDSKDYAAFRQSFDWKKWQHDFHGAKTKDLVSAPSSPTK